MSFIQTSGSIDFCIACDISGFAVADSSGVSAAIDIEAIRPKNVANSNFKMLVFIKCTPGYWLHAKKGSY